MLITILTVTFVYGLLLGSFYNVVALRTLKKEDFVRTSSHCVTCGHRLSMLDMIPVFSWLFLKGRCRYCKEKISGIYPFGELMTAVAYTTVVWYALKNEIAIENVLAHIVFVTIMAIATVSDLKEKMVPDRFFIFGIVSVFALKTVGLLLGHITLYQLGQSVLAGIISYIAMYSVLIISNGKMGGADVKAYGLIGLTIGVPNALCSLFYASFVGLIFYLPKFIISRKRSLTDEEKENPFIPPIFIGVLITYFINIYSFLFNF